jgi:amino acid transporter
MYRFFIEHTICLRTLRPHSVCELPPTLNAHCVDIYLAALYFVGGVRVTFSTGIAAGGNLAYWTSYLVTMVFTFITAAVIAEVCSASPSAGSIYIWAAEAGGPRFGRLLGFVVAWWSTTAWTTFCASMSAFPCLNFARH